MSDIAEASRMPVYLMIEEARLGVFRLAILPVESYDSEFNPLYVMTRLSPEVYTFEEAARRVHDLYVLLGKADRMNADIERVIKNYLPTASQIEIDEIADILDTIHGFLLARGAI